MSESIIDRINIIIKALGIKTQKDFAAMIDVLPTNLSKMLQGKRPIGDAIINKIVLETGISKTWLLTGKGSMTKSSSDEHLIYNVGDGNISAIDGSISRSVAGNNNRITNSGNIGVSDKSKDEALRLLMLENENLKKQLADKEKLIQLYEKLNK